ncbi:unnamed protein product [Leuciscus chuanchicus]
MEEVETAEELLAKQQRKEKKDLQAKIQTMKNAVPKNDKKRRKQLTEDIAKLETELDQKHENELKHLQNSSSVEEVSNALESVSLPNNEEKTDPSKPSRTSKAQKKRDKKAALEKEREVRIAEAEVENLTGSRHQEGLKLRQKLMEKHLQIKEISSDGHCMYRAVEDQLTERSTTLSLKELRAQTAQYMRSHADDFLPFLTDPNSGDMYTADEFEKYCNDVADTAAWGGQLEGALGWKNLKILDVAGNFLSVFPVGFQFLTLDELFFEGNSLVQFTLMESIQEKEVLTLKELSARLILQESTNSFSVVSRALPMYPDLQDVLSHWGQCDLCSQPFLTTWLECVQFINTKKHMGMKSSQSVPVRVLLCSYDCFNRDDHQYYGLA